MDKAELVNLLAKNEQSPLVSQLLRELSDQTVFTATRPVSIHNVRSIYRLRSIRNESRGEPIKGFPELMLGLYKFAGEEIIIYSIDSDASSYIIFADAAQEEFAGVLKFPQTTLEQASVAQSDLQAA